MAGAFGAEFNLDEVIQDTTTHETGAILNGRVVAILGDDVIIEVGLKSEGAVDLGEFEDAVFLDNAYGIGRAHLDRRPTGDLQRAALVRSKRQAHAKRPQHCACNCYLAG